MYKLGLLDYSKLSFEKLDIDGPTKITMVNYPADKTLKLYIHGTVAEPPSSFGSEDPILSFKFRPIITDIPKFMELEELLVNSEAHKEQLSHEGILVDNFDFRPTLDQDNYLRLKLKTKDDGKWKFYSNEKITKENMENLFAQATPITVAVSCGFYFSDESNKYGLFYVLKDLIFDEKPLYTPTTETKKFLKKSAKK